MDSRKPHKSTISSLTLTVEDPKKNKRGPKKAKETLKNREKEQAGAILLKQDNAHLNQELILLYIERFFDLMTRGQRTRNRRHGRERVVAEGVARIEAAVGEGIATERVTRVETTVRRRTRIRIRMIVASAGAAGEQESRQSGGENCGLFHTWVLSKDC